MTLKSLRYLAPVIGLAILGFVISRIGLHNLLQSLGELGWKVVPIISLSLINYLLFTLAWRFCLEAEENPPPFRRLFHVKTIGEAVNASTPLNFAVGDPLRVYLLQGDVVWQGGTRSIVIDRTLYIAAVVTFILMGALFFLGHGFLPGRLAGPLLIGLGFLILSLGALVFLQRTGFFAFLLRIGDLFRLTRRLSAKKRDQFRVVDQLIQETYRRHPTHLLAAFGAHFVTRLIMVLETWLILTFLGISLPFGTVWGLTALVPLVNFIFNIIPGGLGVLEGVVGLVFYLLHLNPAIGVSLQLVRRIRSGFWVILGWSLLTVYRRRDHAVPENS